MRGSSAAPRPTAEAQSRQLHEAFRHTGLHSEPWDEPREARGSADTKRRSPRQRCHTLQNNASSRLASHLRCAWLRGPQRAPETQRPPAFRQPFPTVPPGKRGCGFFHVILSRFPIENGPPAAARSTETEDPPRASPATPSPAGPGAALPPRPSAPSGAAAPPGTDRHRRPARRQCPAAGGPRRQQQRPVPRRTTNGTGPAAARTAAALRTARPCRQPPSCGHGGGRRREAGRSGAAAAAPRPKMAAALRGAGRSVPQRRGSACWRLCF